MLWTSYRDTLYDVLHKVNPVDLSALADALYAARERGATVFTCGNGGSAANASHLAQDLSKGTEACKHGKPLRAISLCDNVGAITAWANDTGYADIFCAQLHMLAQPQDILIAISGSGNSQNVYRAVRWAHTLDLRTWGIVGFGGGKLMRLAHRHVHVPCDDMGMVEAAHAAVFHWVVDELRGRFQDVKVGLSIMDGEGR